MKIITDFRILIALAHEVGKANKRGNKEEIEKVEREHNAYKELCLRAKEVSLGISKGEFGNTQETNI